MLRLPKGILPTLETLVMEPEMLRVELDALEAASPSVPEAPASLSITKATSLNAVEASGLRLASLTALLRLLEAKVCVCVCPSNWPSVSRTRSSVCLSAC
jgi:hypothetical protein